MNADAWLVIKDGIRLAVFLDYEPAVAYAARHHAQVRRMVMA